MGENAKVTRVVVETQVVKKVEHQLVVFQVWSKKSKAVRP